MPLPSSWRREHEDHDHRADRDDAIDSSVAKMSAEGANDGERPSGSVKRSSAAAEQKRREHEDHDHRVDRDESIDCPVAMKSAEGAATAEPTGVAKQSRAAKR